MKCIKSGVLAPLFAVALLLSTSSTYSMQYAGSGVAWILKQAASKLFSSQPAVAAAATYATLEVIKRGSSVAAGVAAIVPHSVIPGSARIRAELKKRPHLAKAVTRYTRAKYLNRAQNAILLGYAAYGVYSAINNGLNVYNNHNRRFDEIVQQNKELAKQADDNAAALKALAEKNAQDAAQAAQAAQAERERLAKEAAEKLAKVAQESEGRDKIAQAERERLAKEAKEQAERFAAENEARQKQMAEGNEKQIEAAKQLLMSSIDANAKRLQHVQMGQALLLSASQGVHRRLNTLSQGALQGIQALQDGQAQLAAGQAALPGQVVGAFVEFAASRGRSRTLPHQAGPAVQDFSGLPQLEYLSGRNHEDDGGSGQQ